MKFEEKAKRDRSLQVYLCYPPEDKKFVAKVAKLYDKLQQDRVLCWFEEEDLLPGQNWDYENRTAISKSDVLIICLSKAALNTPGKFHMYMKFALNVTEEQPVGALVIIPLRFDDCELPFSLGKLKPVDYFDEANYSRLLRSLYAKAESLKLTKKPSSTPGDISASLEAGIKEPTPKLDLPSEDSSPSNSLSSSERSELREFLEKRFSIEELETLAFDLSVDHQLFPHNTKEAFSRGLIEYFEKREGLSPLLKRILQKRNSPFIEGLLGQRISSRNSFPSASPNPVQGNVQRPKASPPPAMQVDLSQLVPEEFEPLQLFELSKKLLACRAMQDSVKRQIVLNLLPKNIQNHIAVDSTLANYVYNIVYTCNQFPEGTRKLLEAVQYVEDGSTAAWGELVDFLKGM
jgi:hypothetical protein